MLDEGGDEVTEEGAAVGAVAGKVAVFHEAACHVAVLRGGWTVDMGGRSDGAVVLVVYRDCRGATSRTKLGGCHWSALEVDFTQHSPTTPTLRTHPGRR